MKTNCFKVVNFGTGILESTKLTNIIVYPNPTNGEFNIDIVDGIEKVKVFDILGNMVFESGEPKSNFKINIFHPGIYVIQITSNNQLIYKKLVVI
ncbi:MAG: T9SS type A sorting domain-containing protein [Candidatus Kapabacteria bacterium]|nr:T9SS type A sorting domain-containing protein [Candidatus Kapabacteria bacterium]